MTLVCIFAISSPFPSDFLTSPSSKTILFLTFCWHGVNRVCFSGATSAAVLLVWRCRSSWKHEAYSLWYKTATDLISHRGTRWRQGTLLFVMSFGVHAVLVLVKLEKHIAHCGKKSNLIPIFPYILLAGNSSYRSPSGSWTSYWCHGYPSICREKGPRRTPWIRWRTRWHDNRKQALVQPISRTAWAWGLCRR